MADLPQVLVVVSPKLCPKLERVAISQYTEFFNEYGPSFNDVLSEGFKNYGHQLKSFTYNQLYPGAALAKSVTFIDYKLLANSLEHLSVRVVDFRHFEKYDYLFKRLRSLAVRIVQSDSWSSFGHVLKKCPKLRTIDFRGKYIPDEHFKTLVTDLTTFAQLHTKRQVTFMGDFEDDDIILGNLIIKRQD